MPFDDTRRVMIIGLDGATLDLIRPWVEEGILPTFKKLMQEGAWGPLRSTIPPLTPAAWSSFITGVNPGKHGIFDFTLREEASYEGNLVESSLRQAPSLWQLASRAGKRVIVYNVPVTYPPERVNGLMVSGLMTPPGAKDATYPRELQAELEKAVPGHVYSGYSVFRPGIEAEFIHELLRDHEQNLSAARYLMERQPWDLFVMVFQHTDTMGHFMWKHMENHGEGMPEAVRELVANAMRECYRDVDTKMGQLIQEAGEGTRVIVMSDHGHGPLEYGFSVNTWLLEKGYIRAKQDALSRLRYRLYTLGFTPDFAYRVFSRMQTNKGGNRTGKDRFAGIKQRLGRLFFSFDDIDWSRTSAYSSGSFGPIFVNLKGREPHGMVEPGPECEALLDRLTSDLKTVQDPETGRPLFSEFHRGGDIYAGPFSERAPDLFFFPENWKYGAAGRRQFEDNRWFMKLEDDGRTPSIVRARVRYNGTHRMDGILFLSGPGIQPGKTIEGASIVDVAPTVLALLGVPVPKEMDGRVLENYLTPEMRDQLNVIYTARDGLVPELQPVADMSQEDEELLVARLRNLGYVD
jgi:predicted AlkP superfamily phosphohydrolase/phosphomutase